MADRVDATGRLLYTSWADPVRQNPAVEFSLRLETVPSGRNSKSLTVHVLRSDYQNVRGLGRAALGRLRSLAAVSYGAIWLKNTQRGDIPLGWTITGAWRIREPPPPRPIGPFEPENGVLYVGRDATITAGGFSEGVLGAPGRLGPRFDVADLRGHVLAITEFPSLGRTWVRIRRPEDGAFFLVALHGAQEAGLSAIDEGRRGRAVHFASCSLNSYYAVGPRARGLALYSGVALFGDVAIVRDTSRLAYVTADLQGACRHVAKSAAADVPKQHAVVVGDRGDGGQIVVGPGGGIVDPWGPNVP